MTEPRKRVFLHCGTEKTGSTAIQVFCTENRDLLRSRGLYYPETGIGNAFAYGHHELAKLPGEENDASAAEKLWDKAIEEMTAQECDAILLSSEHFWSWTASGDLAWLHDRLSDFDVTVVVYLREQAEYILGSYCTNVIFFGETRSLSTFSETVDKDYLQRLEGFKNLFGRENLIVRPYETGQLHQSDIVDDFFHSLDFGTILHEGLLRPQHRVNPTPPIDVIRLFFALNRLKKQDLTDQLRRVWRFVQTASLLRYTFFSKAEQREIMRYCVNNNAEIARRYMDRVNGVLFNELFIIEPETIELALTTPAELVALFLIETLADPKAN